MPGAMFQAAFSTFDWAITIPGVVLGNLGGLFGPSSRLYLPYLIIAIGIAAAAYTANRKHLHTNGGASFLRLLFNPDVYFCQSSLVDLKVVLANRLFTPFLAAASYAATVVSASAVAGILLGPGADNAMSGEGGQSIELGLFSLALITVMVTIASDFTTYWVHRVSHENSILWPFHKLHHSAEKLTPLTVLRKHPVYDLIRALSNAFLIGPVQGVIFALFGSVDIVVILGVNALYSVFHWTGSNLRHTHIWLSYGPFWSRIFISPAQHQIHHSLAARHHNTNYGEIFALWDWLFRTIYIPDEYEALEFGVADAKGARIAQPHPSLKDAYLVPFVECAGAFRERATTDTTPDEASPAH